MSFRPFHHQSLLLLAATLDALGRKLERMCRLRCMVLHDSTDNSFLGNDKVLKYENP